VAAEQRVLLFPYFKPLTIITKKRNKHVSYCSVHLLPKAAFRFDNYLPQSGKNVLNVWINVRAASRKV
jgi:hypothetical protein